MSRQKLERVLELLINEETDKASDLLHDIFVEKSRKIYTGMIAEDEELEDELDDDLSLEEVDDADFDMSDDEDDFNLDLDDEDFEDDLAGLDLEIDREEVTNESDSRSGSNTVYNSREGWVKEVTTPEQFKVLARGTKWTTDMIDHYFDRYGSIYVVYDAATKKRFAVQIESDSYYDARDRYVGRSGIPSWAMKRIDSVDTWNSNVHSTIAEAEESGMSDMEDMSDEDAEMDLADEMTDDMSDEDENADAEDAFVRVDDAIDELKELFADLVGDESNEDDEYDYADEPKLEESATLTKVTVPGKSSERSMSPVAAPKHDSRLKLANKEEKSAAAPKAKEMGVANPQSNGGRLRKV